jgi:hypothetical protein
MKIASTIRAVPVMEVLALRLAVQAGVQTTGSCVGKEPSW